MAEVGFMSIVDHLKAATKMGVWVKVGKLVK